MFVCLLIGLLFASVSDKASALPPGCWERFGALVDVGAQPDDQQVRRRLLVVDPDQCDAFFSFCEDFVRVNTDPIKSLRVIGFVEQLLASLAQNQMVMKARACRQVSAAPGMRLESFFRDIGFLTPQMKKSAVNAIDYFVRLGFSDEILEDVFCQNAADMLNNPEKYDVSVGSSDCQERTVLFMHWLSSYQEAIRTQNFKAIPKPVKSCLALCWILQGFGQNKNGKDSFEGCAIPETKAIIEAGDIDKFPVNTASCHKRLSHSAQDFFARVRAMVGILTKVELYGQLNESKFNWSYVPVSGVSIPVLDHYNSLQIVFQKIREAGWLCALKLTHFTTGNPFTVERILLFEDDSQMRENPLLTCFEIYTVNLDEFQRSAFATKLSSYQGVESFFITLGGLISVPTAKVTSAAVSVDSLETVAVDRDPSSEKNTAPSFEGIPFITKKLEREMMGIMLKSGQQGVGGRHIWADRFNLFFGTSK